MKTPITLALISLILSGCISSPSELVMEDTPYPQEPILSFEEFILTDCDDISSSVDDFFAEEPANFPEGWSLDPVERTPTVDYRIVQCTKLAFLDIESDNVTLMFEGLAGLIMPDACKQAFGSQLGTKFIRHIYVNNESLAASLSSALGIRAEFAHVELVIDSSAGTYSSTAQWSKEFESPSHITIVHSGTAHDEPPGSWTSSYAWVADNGTLGAMLWDSHYQNSLADSLPASGEIREPHSNPLPTKPTWIGVGEVGVSNIQSNVFSFEDHSCEEP